jgi:hypothetical protein
MIGISGIIYENDGTSFNKKSEIRNGRTDFQIKKLEPAFAADPHF